MGGFQRRGVVDPVAGHRDDVTLLFERLNDAHLLIGSGAREDDLGRVQDELKLARREPVNLVTRHDFRSRRSRQADLPGDRNRRRVAKASTRRPRSAIASCAFLTCARSTSSMARVVPPSEMRTHCGRTVGRAVAIEHSLAFTLKNDGVPHALAIEGDFVDSAWGNEIGQRRAPQSDERRLGGIPDENFPASPISLTKALSE